MYTTKCDEILKKNEKVIKNLFDSNIKQQKKLMTMDECLNLIRKQNLPNIEEEMMKVAFQESLMSKVDTLSGDQNTAWQMRFTEFLAFISRISHHVYSHEELGLHHKIEGCLNTILLKNYTD